jgi:hypothetical protein
MSPWAVDSWNCCSVLAVGSICCSQNLFSLCELCALFCWKLPTSWIHQDLICPDIAWNGLYTVLTKVVVHHANGFASFFLVSCACGASPVDWPSLNLTFNQFWVALDFQKYLIRQRSIDRSHFDFIVSHNMYHYFIFACLVWKSHHHMLLAAGNSVYMNCFHVDGRFIHLEFLETYFLSFRVN